MNPMYERSTRTIALHDVPPAMRAELDAVAEARQLTVLDDSRAWLTRSVNKSSSSGIGRLFGRRANPLDPDAEHETLVVLLRSQLVVVIAGAVRGVSSLSVALSRASVSAGSVLGGPGDTGFAITGFPAEEGRAGSFYIGLGPEPAGSECYETIRAAITEAKR
ncbi:MAG: hypothetical protein QM658_14885 [Gordonia sp. (in: high G+C Gram-positive bacteria)]